MLYFSTHITKHDHCIYICLLGIYFVTDIDECAEFNGDCEHNCTNTIGSYYCTCDEDYSLDKDGHNCTEYTVCEHLNCGLMMKYAVVIMIAGKQ